MRASRVIAEVTLIIGGHRYGVACQVGQEEHLLAMGALIDSKAQEARAAVGGLSEARQLLFAALLLADALTEAQNAEIVPRMPDDSASLEPLALRLEALATRLEYQNE